ncbi:unnamed protein product, partial [Discosporangium mesarthrocarpum]
SPQKPVGGGLGKSPSPLPGSPLPTTYTPPTTAPSLGAPSPQFPLAPAPASAASVASLPYPPTSSVPSANVWQDSSLSYLPATEGDYSQGGTVPQSGALEGMGINGGADGVDALDPLSRLLQEGHLPEAEIGAGVGAVIGGVGVQTSADGGSGDGAGGSFPIPEGEVFSKGLEDNFGALQPFTTKPVYVPPTHQTTSHQMPALPPPPPDGASGQFPHGSSLPPGPVARSPPAPPVVPRRDTLEELVEDFLGLCSTQPPDLLELRARLAQPGEGEEEEEGGVGERWIEELRQLAELRAWAEVVSSTSDMMEAYAQ